MRGFGLFASVLAITMVGIPYVIAAEEERSPVVQSSVKQIARQCLSDLEEFNEELARVGFGILPPRGYTTSIPSSYYVYGVEGTPREKIHSFREAAYVYAHEGNETSCQMLLASMRKIYVEHNKVVGSEADDPNARTAWRRAHLARARPVAEMKHLMRADVVIGADIRNINDKKLGEIADIVLDPGRRSIAYVLASHGGFMGFGEKVVSVRWSDLRATEDHELYVLNVSPEAFDAAPSVDPLDFERIAGESWTRSLDRYWEGALKK